ncbi:MAG: bifunctional oligoribonuclease/PAP phosphatase NrnA [Ardenticatenales bacterium]|nr:bifunctional oligoribonuclease/PAP phosphatase NrnA [Ardenticatenales bacterium]
MVYEKIKALIDEANHILVITHIRPDGDALGSLTAMGQALQQLGKKCTLVCDDGMLERFRFLTLADDVLCDHPLDAQYDLAIAVDCGDQSRMGKAFTTIPEPVPTLINIDHHITNTEFGDVNLLDAEATSAAEILFDLLPALGVSWTPDLAKSVLTGIVTDTLCFRVAGTTHKTLQAAAVLTAAGANLPEITMQAINIKPLSTLRLWREGLINMKMEGGLLWTSISKEAREAAGFPGNGNAGLVSFLGNAEQAAMGIVMTEMDGGRVIVGLRCRPPYDVSELAMALGGGGHPLAAGATMDGPLEKVERLVVSMAREYIANQTAL